MLGPAEHEKVPVAGGVHAQRGDRDQRSHPGVEDHQRHGQKPQL